MRFVPTNCICEGMIVGKHLLGRNGELLLSTGTVIRSAYIEKIKELGYNGIYIEDEISKDIEISELINDSLRFKTVKTMKDAFMCMEKGKSMSSQQVKAIADLTNEIIDNILSNKDIMVNMIDLKVFDDYTFYHSVNVAVLSIVVGIALNLNKSQLSKLGLSAILHDIGKVFIPRDILNKPGKLEDNEFDLIRSHPFKGYQYLKDKYEIPASAYVGILQHHEKYDGSGYPGGIEAGNISLFARIIAVADVYDALTSDRPYRRAMIPSEAIEYLMGGGGSLFDPEIVNCFTQRIAPYPTGTCVVLSNKNIGVVVENYKDCCLRPKIKIIMHDNVKIDPYIIDLRNDPNTIGITITGTLNQL